MHASPKIDSLEKNKQDNKRFPNKLYMETSIEDLGCTLGTSSTIVKVSNDVNVARNKAEDLRKQGKHPMVLGLNTKTLLADATVHIEKFTDANTGDDVQHYVIQGLTDAHRDDASVLMAYAPRYAKELTEQLLKK